MDNPFTAREAAIQLSIIAGEPDPIFDFRAIPERKGCKGARKIRGRLSKVADTLAQLNAEGRAIYFTPAITDGVGVKKDNVLAARALVLDLDGAPLPEEWEVAPHIISETSHGKFQCFWALEPTPDIAAYEAVARRLAKRYGGDASVCDAGHVFRLAGFLHQKRKPFRSRLVSKTDPKTLRLGSFERRTLAEFDFLPEFPEPERVKGEPSGDPILDAEGAALVLKHFDPPEFAVTEANGDTKWRNLAMALHEASGGSLEVRDVFKEWCAGDPDYAGDEQQGEIDARWGSFGKNNGPRVGIGTLHHLCVESGVPDDVIGRIFRDPVKDFDGEPIEDREGDFDFEGEPNAIAPIETRGFKVNRNSIAADTLPNALAAIHRAGLGLAWNELRDIVVFRAKDLPWREDYGRVLNDHTLRMIRAYLMNQHQRVGFEPSEKNVFDAAMTLAYEVKFNPVRDYLESLKWDGVPRLASLFGRYFNCGDDSYTRGVSIAFMVGAVRRMRKPGSKFDTMPVLKSPQGWQKSTAVKVLFGEEYFSDSKIDIGSKDAAMILRGIWCQEFAELEALRRSETAALKAFISRATDRQRDPYGRVADDHPRHSVFIGTTNESAYLKDGTGSRRFWPLTVNAPIDLSPLKADRDHLWAEASALERRGESDVLPRELWEEAGKRQAKETAADPWIDEIRDFLDMREQAYRNRRPEDEIPAPPPYRVTASELYEALGISADRRTKETAARLRVVMEAGLRWQHRENVRVLDRVSTGFRLRRDPAEA